MWGIYNRRVADDKFSSKQILKREQCCLDALRIVNGYSAYQVAPGSDPANQYGREVTAGAFSLLGTPHYRASLPSCVSRAS